MREKCAELYYAMVNIVDYHAKNHFELSNEMNACLNYLSREAEISMADFGDANDIGSNCETWDEVVYRFMKLFDKGERR